VRCTLLFDRVHFGYKYYGALHLAFRPGHFGYKYYGALHQRQRREIFVA
jgi:hypothetical protein